ncbi:hypothetical protein B0H16DRAFT_1683673 [Mycena metata]|uniref:Uncharacterized protein n=1 Tax=Mycena metata TaxID=1033252 RepID=A0AAD7K4V8_9AGAR|nr:hypothetical protein B0H16DRAFT_1683673 [Mycena metata]
MSALPQVPPPVPPPVRYKGKLDKMDKKTLQAIAGDMGMEDVKGTKAVLTSYIETSMARFPSTFQDDPRFTGLYDDARKKTKGHKAKNSASKAAEDTKDASKPAEPLTGANLTLFQQGNTTDPRPSFKPLSLKIQGQNVPSPNEQDANSGGSSPLPSITEFEEEFGPEAEGDQQEQAEDKKVVPGTPPGQKACSTILLRFSHPTDTHQPAQQVAVNDASIIKTTSADGTIKHQAELTKLLPKGSRE